MSIKPKSNGVHGAKDTFVFPNATAENTSPYVVTGTTVTGQRIEQMYQLADIFASIFEASAEEHEHAIATKRDAA
jgi:hypothetical protein